MARPPNILRSIPLKYQVPEDIRAKLDLHLFSEVEGRVPHGGYTKFLSDRLREFFEWRTLDTGFGVIRGPAETIARIRTLIEASNV